MDMFTQLETEIVALRTKATEYTDKANAFTRKANEATAQADVLEKRLDALLMGEDMPPSTVTIPAPVVTPKPVIVAAPGVSILAATEAPKGFTFGQTPLATAAPVVTPKPVPTVDAFGNPNTPPTPKPETQAAPKNAGSAYRQALMALCRKYKLPDTGNVAALQERLTFAKVAFPAKPETGKDAKPESKPETVTLGAATEAPVTKPQTQTPSGNVAQMSASETNALKHLISKYGREALAGIIRVL